MNERNINSYALNEKISNFKKKYTDLLMQLDSSALLNVSKFENIENFQGDNNLFSLLKENEKVSNNLKLIKESIRSKILNLQILSAKTNDKDLIDLYGNMYDFNVLNEMPSYYESSFSKSQMQKIISDIDTAMNKIDEMSKFIETKVIPKLNDAEKENKSLTSLLNDSQKKIEELIVEKDIDQQTIAKLDASNKEWEIEFNKLVDLWVDLNQKFLSLDSLISENEKTNKEISDEKDKLIEKLENKINELLTDLESSESFAFRDFNNVYKITDAFTNLLNKIFTETFKYVYSFENNYFGKIKDFNKKRDLLISDFNKTKKIKDKHVLIPDLSEDDLLDDLNDDVAIFDKQLNYVKNIEDFKSFINSHYIDRFNEILSSTKNVNEMFQKVVKGQTKLFSSCSIRRLNNFINQLNTYYEKVNIFKDQVVSFIGILSSFDNSVFKLISFSDYWANACYAFAMISAKIRKDFLVIEKILNIFIYFLNSTDGQFINFEEEFNKIVDESMKDASKKLPKKVNRNMNSTSNSNNVSVMENSVEINSNPSVLNNFDNDFFDDSNSIENKHSFEHFNQNYNNENNNEDLDFIYLPEKDVEFVAGDINSNSSHQKSLNNYNYESDIKDFANTLKESNHNNFIDLGTIDIDRSDEFIHSFNNSPLLKNEINYVHENSRRNQHDKNNYEVEFINDNVHKHHNNDKGFNLKSFESIIQKLEKDEENFDFDHKPESIHNLYNKIKDVDLIDEKLSLLSESHEINYDTNNQINDFYSFSRKILRELEFKSDLSVEMRISCKNALYKILSDEETTIKEKIEKIEIFLLKVFENDFYNKSFYYWIIVFKNYLLEKKYNINLKLRIVKTKLSKMKILLELEREKNYLSLFDE